MNSVESSIFFIREYAKWTFKSAFDIQFVDYLEIYSYDDFEYI